ncbi:MAG: RNA 2',3'-cyclic phosphodiesterase [Gaiellaceae bacterium]
MSDERLRLFCALQLPDETIDDLAAWQEVNLRGGRIVPRENLHVTLAFLGSRPAAEVPAIMGELRGASSVAEPIELRPVRYRETRSVGMIVLEDVGGAATALAEDLAERLERRGVYRSERRPWLSHVTVLRFRERAGLSPEVGNIRSINVVRSALYRSSLGRGPAGNRGARYDALETAALGGR